MVCFFLLEIWLGNLGELNEFAITPVISFIYQGTAIRDRLQVRLIGQHSRGLLRNGKADDEESEEYFDDEYFDDGDDSEYYYDDEEYYETEEEREDIKEEKKNDQGKKEEKKE